MSHRVLRPMLVVGLVVGFCVSSAGCRGAKITRANADKIKVGMSEKEINDILGAPTETVEFELPLVAQFPLPPEGKNFHLVCLRGLRYPSGGTGTNLSPLLSWMARWLGLQLAGFRFGTCRY